MNHRLLDVATVEQEQSPGKVARGWGHAGGWTPIEHREQIRNGYIEQARSPEGGRARQGA
jgi:hypothetical protein